MRISSLAVAAGFTMALTACDPGTSLRGEALTGFVSDRDTPDDVSHDVVFHFNDLPEGEPDCSWVPQGSITFDGEVYDREVGGITTGFITPSVCNGINMVFSLDATDTRDGKLEIAHAETGVVSYVGKNLIADRRFIPANGLTVGAGGVLRFRYEPSTDITSNPRAWLRTNAEDPSFELTASKENGEIVVTFPRDTPAGEHTLNLRFDLEIPTVVCDGFSSCAITGQHFEQVTITVQE
jgi:hypothetical protein